MTGLHLPYEQRQRRVVTERCTLQLATTHCVLIGDYLWLFNWAKIGQRSRRHGLTRMEEAGKLAVRCVGGTRPLDPYRAGWVPGATRAQLSEQLYGEYGELKVHQLQGHASRTSVHLCGLCCRPQSRLFESTAIEHDVASTLSRLC